jgi:hypothetical protein
MSFLAGRTGLSVGIGSIATFVGGIASAIFAFWNVLSSTGTSYSVSRTVLDSAGTAYTVPAVVLSSNGTAYTPI